MLALLVAGAEGLQGGGDVFEPVRRLDGDADGARGQQGADAPQVLRRRQCRDVRAAFSELVARTKAAGSLRADFSPEDLILLYMAVAGITRYAGPSAPAAVGRFVALALDGYRARAATPAPPPVSKRTMALRLRQASRSESASAASGEHLAP